MMDDEEQTSGAADEGQAEDADAALGYCYTGRDCTGDEIPGMYTMEKCQLAGGLSWRGWDRQCRNIPAS
jgi:hypothetical protein